MREISVTVWDSVTLETQRVEGIYVSDAITLTIEEVHELVCVRTNENPAHWEVVPEVSIIRPEGGCIFLQETPQHPGFDIRSFSTYSFIITGGTKA